MNLKEQMKLFKKKFNMKRVMILKRVHHNKDGTFGVLIDKKDNQIFGLSIELPWQDNQPYISCIPKGNYICKRIVSGRHGETFEITGVKNRFAILFHVANTIMDLEGCVGVAEMFQPLYGMNAVLYSRMGFREFMQRLEGESEFLIKIKEYF